MAKLKKEKEKLAAKMPTSKGTKKLAGSGGTMKATKTKTKTKSGGTAKRTTTLKRGSGATSAKAPRLTKGEEDKKRKPLRRRHG